MPQSVSVRVTSSVTDPLLHTWIVKSAEVASQARLVEAHVLVTVTLGGAGMLQLLEAGPALAVQLLAVQETLAVLETSEPAVPDLVHEKC